MRGLVKIPLLGLSVPKTHTLHIIQPWVSVLIPFYFNKNPLWFGLNKAQIYEYSNMSLRVTLLLCSFSWRILGFSLNPRPPVHSQVLGHFSSVRYWFCISESYIQWESERLDQHITQGGHYRKSQVYGYVVLIAFPPVDYLSISWMLVIKGEASL